MSEMKIVVPDNMLDTVNQESAVAQHMEDEDVLKIIRIVLRWLIYDWNMSPNKVRMPEPWYSRSLQKWNEWNSQWKSHSNVSPGFVDSLIFFGNRLNERFLAPEPEVPEEIKDLLAYTSSGAEGGLMPKYNPVQEAIIEAYRRGQKSIPE